MRVKLPAAPATLVPNSMSHVDRGNGGVVEWAPETLCRRSAFDDKPTDREKEVVTVRAWRRSRFVSVLTVCSPGVVPFTGRRCQWHARSRERSEGRSLGGLFGLGAPGIFRGCLLPRGVVRPRGRSPGGAGHHDHPR
jgi:hypothetical protein